MSESKDVLAMHYTVERVSEQELEPTKSEKGDG